MLNIHLDLVSVNIKDLLTEWEVCTGNYCLRFFVQTEQTRLMRALLYGFVGLQCVVTL